MKKRVAILFVSILLLVLLAPSGAQRAPGKNDHILRQKRGRITATSVHHIITGNDNIIYQDLTLDDGTTVPNVVGGCEVSGGDTICQGSGYSEPVNIGDNVTLTKHDKGQWSAKKEPRGQVGYLFPFLDKLFPALEAYVITSWPWATNLTYVVNTATTEATLQTASLITNAVTLVANRWVPYFSHTLASGGTTATAGRFSNDGVNRIYFIDTDNGTRACDTLWTAVNGHIVDADMGCYTGYFIWFGSTSSVTAPTTGCSNGQWLDNIMTHEMGHMLGMGHSLDTTATMYAYFYGPCATIWRSLEADDRAGMGALYPPATVVAPAAVTAYLPTSGATNVTDTTTDGRYVRWNASSGATSYSVYHDTNNPPTTLVGTITSTQNQSVTYPGTYYMAVTRAQSTTYRWKVVATNDGGSTASSVFNYTTAAGSGSSCTYGLSSTALTFAAAGGVANVTVTPSAGTCAWTTSSPVSWVGITGATTGTGSARVSVAKNRGRNSRNTTLTIAGTSVTVDQAGR